MLSTSKDANKNYLAKIVNIEEFKNHPNADRLKMAIVDYQNVITGIDSNPGLYVFFPLESELNKGFVSSFNGFRDEELNQDKEKSGFFEYNARVKALRLRGERSMGFILPVQSLFDYVGKTFDVTAGTEFDTIGKDKIIQKYRIQKVESKFQKRKYRKPALSRLVENQFKFHTDTENLRKNAFKIKPDDDIVITYKVHGTSMVCSNVLVKRKLNIFERLLKKVGVKVKETEYDVVYSSRRVVKNSKFKDPKRNDNYYDKDVWNEVYNEIKDRIPKGFSVYGEIVGYVDNNKYIQKGYDYSCVPGQKRFFVYRVTFTNEDGNTFELSYDNMVRFCTKYGFETPKCFYYGKASGFAPNEEKLISRLERRYNEKDCFMCINKVPEEGIVLRVEKLDEFEAYKLKSFRFLERETSSLDSQEEDMEEMN